MTTVEKIKQCSTPQEALLVLAQAIDDISGKVAPTDPWSQPLQWDAADEGDGAKRPEDLEPATEQAAAQQRRLEALRAKLAEATDPSDIKAIEAQIRLAQDTAANIPAAAQVRGEEPAEGGIIEVPPASPERIAERMQWAKRVGLEQYMLNAAALSMTEAGPEELYAWFGKVGPKGLHTHDRLAMVQLPIAERRWLVEDAARDDQALAQDIGADILKSEEAISKEQAREIHEGSWHG